MVSIVRDGTQDGVCAAALKCGFVEQMGFELEGMCCPRVLTSERATVLLTLVFPIALRDDFDASTVRIELKFHFPRLRLLAGGCFFGLYPNSSKTY